MRDQKQELRLKFKKLDRLKDMKQILLLESIYAKLLGPAFRYRVGIQREHTDLFFWNVLQNRVDLAETMWKHVMHPVRTAITASR